MRDGGPNSLYVAGAAGWYVTVASWLGDALLAENVPIMAGRVTSDVSQQVPERVTLTVPRTSVVDGHTFDWRPGADPAHPLARYGQVLDVQIVVYAPSSGVHYQTRIGRFLIQSWSEQDDGAVSVEGVGVMQVAANDRLTEATAPRVNGTLVSEFVRLLPQQLSVDIDPALVDRACPASMDWQEDRLGALYDIADAWPARLRSTTMGGLQLLPPLSSTPVPVLTLTDGSAGTVVSAPRTDSRDSAYNRVVARGDGADSGTTTPGAPIQSIRDQQTGPMATSGAYGIVTRFYSSPLITSQAIADSAADSLLANSLRASQTIPVEFVPDPRLDIDDAVKVVKGSDTWIGYVIAYDLPLTAADGTMRIDVGVQQ